MVFLHQRALATHAVRGRGRGGKPVGGLGKVHQRQLAIHARSRLGEDDSIAVETGLGIPAVAAACHGFGSLHLGSKLALGLGNLNGFPAGSVGEIRGVRVVDMGVVLLDPKAAVRLGRCSDTTQQLRGYSATVGS